MKELILPVSMIIICAIGLFFMKKLAANSNKTNSSRTRDKASDITVQEFVNVKDIQDIFLYTKDGYLISYIKVHPISTDLLSLSEQKVLSRRLTDEFSDMDYSCFKFLAVSRPVDITPVVTDYADLIAGSDDQIQKEILRQETRVISEFSLSGEVVQREFYYVIWDRDRENVEIDLKKRAHEFMQKFDNAGIKSEILKRHDIIRLCNLTNNPAYATIEDTDVDLSFTLLTR